MANWQDSFPKYETKKTLETKILSTTTTPPTRTKSGMWELEVAEWHKPTDPKIITNEDGLVLTGKLFTVLVTLQDLSWLCHECKTKYFTTVPNKKNSQWSDFAEWAP